MLDAAIRTTWYLVSLGASLSLVLLLLCRHIFESRLGPRTRIALKVAPLPLFLVFVTYIVAGVLL